MVCVLFSVSNYSTIKHGTSLESVWNDFSSFNLMSKDIDLISEEEMNQETNSFLILGWTTTILIRIHKVIWWHCYSRPSKKIQKNRGIFRTEGHVHELHQQVLLHVHGMDIHLGQKLPLKFLSPGKILQSLPPLSLPLPVTILSTYNHIICLKWPCDMLIQSIFVQIIGHVAI